MPILHVEEDIDHADDSAEEADRGAPAMVAKVLRFFSML